jgi:hypothetical protein
VRNAWSGSGSRVMTATRGSPNFDLVVNYKSVRFQNCEANTSVDRQRLSSCHVVTATDTHATTEELLETGFSFRSVPRLYNHVQLPLRQGPETALRRA